MHIHGFTREVMGFWLKYRFISFENLKNLSETLKKCG